MRIRQFCIINVVQNEENLHTKGRVDSIPATQLIHSSTDAKAIPLSSKPLSSFVKANLIKKKNHYLT